MAGPGIVLASGLRLKLPQVEALGPAGVRALIAGCGALAAAGCGMALALALRLPAEMTAPDAPQETATVEADQTPAEATVRAYALQNPPVYPIDAPAEGQDQTGAAADAADPAAAADDAPATDAAPADRTATGASPS